VQLILDHGKLTPPMMSSQLFLHDAKSTSSGCLHIVILSLTSPPAYEQALHKLVTAQYLKASTVLSHQSPRDKLIKYEAEERQKLAGLPTSRQLSECRDLAEARLRREEREAEKIGIVSLNLFFW
jgi:DNA-directed RNA polymerase III subunit RPC3